MIGWRKRGFLRHYLEQGMTRTALAEKFGVSRRTVYHWIQTGQLDRDLSPETVRYGPRSSVPRRIDPYKPINGARLEGFPELSAVRLFQEIKATGYSGGYTQVKEYVRTVRPRPPEEPVVRFGAPPGHQGQVDFADFRLPWGKRYALLVILGLSRVFWLQYFRRKTMENLFQGLEAAFLSFGGIPAELLFDQLKAVIIKDERDDGGRILENTEFPRFAHHWGFRIRACRPYRALTKGKVERPVSYGRRGFFYGRTFLNDDDLNHQARSWVDTIANVRIHGTLKERPIDRFKGEQEVLKPPPSRPYRSLVLPARATKPTRPSSRALRSSVGPWGRLCRVDRRSVMRAPVRSSRHDRIRPMSADLKIPGALKGLDQVLTAVDGGGVTASEAVEPAPGGPDHPAQQSASPCRNALLQAPGRKDPRRLRLLVPAIHQAGADRLPA